jgi:hypothetical protein
MHPDTKHNTSRLFIEALNFFFIPIFTTTGELRRKKENPQYSHFEVLS